MYLRNREQQRSDVLIPMMQSYKKTQPCVELGNPWFHPDNTLRPKTLNGSLRRNLQKSPKTLVPHSRGMARSSMDGGGASVSNQEVMISIAQPVQSCCLRGRLECAKPMGSMPRGLRNMLPSGLFCQGTDLTPSRQYLSGMIFSFSSCLSSRALPTLLSLP